MKKWFYIHYWDKYQNPHTTQIKARNIKAAEEKFYNKHPITLITKISQIN